MDTLRIIKQEGYRFENLSEKNQAIIRWLNFLKEDFKSFDMSVYDIDCMNPQTTIEKMKAEVAEEVIEAVERWMEIQIAEYQISLIESQDN